jgi:hypothetical protein
VPLKILFCSFLGNDLEFKFIKQQNLISEVLL